MIIREILHVVRDQWGLLRLRRLKAHQYIENAEQKYDVNSPSASTAVKKVPVVTFLKEKVGRAAGAIVLTVVSD